MMQFTPEQRLAIETRGQDMLVSAAAGSGKTAVLTERILRHITEGVDGAPPLDIDDLLVVTFTEAAAAEMRERIAEKIDERLKRDPGNTHLQRQAALLPTAQVSTIHAFCRRLVKEHFTRVDLDPAFKVGDETELALIQSKVMEEIFEAEYATSDNDAFLDLSEAFGGRTRDDRLDELVRAVNRFIESCTDPEAAARSYADLFARGAADLDETPWTGIVRNDVAVGLAGALRAVRTAQALCLAPEGPERYLAALRNDESTLLSLSDTLARPFSQLYEAFTAIEWSRLPAYRANDDVNPALKERVKSLRDREIKGRINKIKDDCFFTKPQKMQTDIEALRPRVEALIALSLRYRKRYDEEKRLRNLLDFSDLEHYAIRILTSGSPEDPAPVFSFREVLIDEYQDSNAVQELILSTVAGGAPRFMVGDVKQSIYRFRRANPKLFIDKYDRYLRLATDTETPPTAPVATPVRVDLSRNFRSRTGVLDTVNFFFSQLMSPEVGEVDYDEHAALYPGADFPPPPFPYETVVDLIDTAPAETDAEDGDVPEIDKVELEARVIAQRVRSLIGQRIIWDSGKQAYRPCRNGDIVILARSIASVAGALTEALKKYEVDAVADISTGFFETLEINTSLSFLRVVDNPRQDIDLITVLHSPVYAFTPDELLAVRGMDAEADYYDCLKQYAESPSGGKARLFLANLENWRTRAVYLPVSRLIGVIYDDTRYPAYAGAMPGGRIRQANLRLLLERAIEYETTSFKGLFHFVRYIERLRETGGAGSVNAAQAGAGEDRIRIMSIHKAKGLEFPIVFVSRLGQTLNREDERRNVVMHQEYGLGPSYLDLTLRTKANTLARLALSKLVRQESLSEELRVLYVAMTRAKEMLILTGCVSDWEKQRALWAAAADITEEQLPVHQRRECASYLDWLMPCLARHHDTAHVFGEAAPANAAVYHHPARFNLCIHSAAEDIEQAAPGSHAAIVSVSHPLITETPVTLSALPYPFEETRDLPSKVSISELKRLYALETTPDSAPLYDAGQPVYDAPVFIQEMAGVTAQRRGTAIHTVAEHIDLHKHRTREGIEALIQDLAERNLLTQEEQQAVNRTAVERFANSKLADRIRAAGEVRREVPFVMGLTPREVYPDRAFPPEENDEIILVHGIIDCYFEEDGHIVLLDYKSDAVTGDPHIWAERHRVQMGIYKKAVANATGKEVSETLLYSFALGETVAVTESPVIPATVYSN